jgi:hypothetical protein
MQGDDVTGNNYFWIEEQGRVKAMRGEFLVASDVRSSKILGFVLITGKYRALHIRTLFTRVFAVYGLPKRLIFENGLWKDSRLVTGGSKARTPFSDERCELGLGQYGIKFTHARRSRGKPIEGTFNLIQPFMAALKGYCGRNERFDRPEILSDQLRRINKGEDPRPFLMSAEECCEAFGKIVEQYNDTAQEGKTLEGLTPNEAFKRYENKEDPPQSFSAEARYLLAHQEIETEVGREGIVLTYGNERRYYYGKEELGARQFERVRVFYNPEEPEYIAVTGLHLENPIVVKQVAAIPRIGATDEEIETTERLKDAHIAAPRALYKVVAGDETNVRGAGGVDERTLDLGRKIEEHKKAEARRKTAALAKARKAQSLADGGIPVELGSDNPEGWEEIRDLLNHQAEASQGGAE